MNYRSFVDVLFILLLSAIVMLAQSFQLGGLDMAPAKVGAGAVSPLQADDVRVIVVQEEALLLDEESYSNVARLSRSLAPADPVLLVAASPGISHQRVMSVWSAFKEQGRDVRLGVAPDDPDADEAKRESE